MRKINLKSQAKNGSINIELLSSGAIQALTSGAVTDVSYVSGVVTGLVSDVSALDGRLDTLEGGSGVVGSVAKSLADAKAYADQKVADLVDSAPETLNTLNELANALGDDPNFATTISNMVGTVSGNVGTEASARAAADTFLSGAITGVVADLGTETSARGAADTYLSGAITGVVADLGTEASARGAADTFLSGAITGVVADLATEVTNRTNADTALDNKITFVSGAVTGAVADIAALDGRLDTLEGGSGTVGSVAKALSDAKVYADQKVADLVDSAPAVLDTLKELATALGNDANFSTTITNLVGTVSGNVATEAGARAAADTFISGAVTGVVADLATEVSARGAADTFLSGAITGVVADLAAETSARQAADTFVSGAVTGAVADLTALTSAFNSFKAAIGMPVDAEEVTFDGSGEYVLAAAPSGIVSGSKPILAINGVVQEYGSGFDFEVVAVGGVMKKLKLTAGFVLEAGDTAVVWYRAAV